MHRSLQRRLRGIAPPVLDAAVTTLPSEAMDRDDAVAGPDDLLQLDRGLLVRRKPVQGRANHAFLTAMRVARVVGQDVVLEDDVGVEEGPVGLAARLPHFARGAQPFRILRHRQPSIAPGGEGYTPGRIRTFDLCLRRAQAMRTLRA